ncbi:MAG: MerR family transcriptional regulator [Candidatus Eremiobacteraeota bacterium]|nr:MerR family transcriptional regulator [Candidatus Eremiobacteraeota bacterium]
MDQDSEPYYVISVVSKMLKVHPQTIRHYERLGLLSPPHRTQGNMRLYSKRDVERLEQICSFTNVGVNLAGVEVIVKLLEKMESMRVDMLKEMEDMRGRLESSVRNLHTEDNADDI